MKTIIIYAIASKSTGALTILTDLLEYLELHKDESIYHLFTCMPQFVKYKNIRTHFFKKQNWATRILFDDFGFKNYCKKNNLNPDLIVSMQNTGVNYPQTKQLIYYHQSLPLIKYNWNILDKREFKLFLYAHFYFFFVQHYLKKSYIVVQLEYIKELFINKFNKNNFKDISVIRPNTPFINIENVKTFDFSHNKLIYIYPATNYRYKNHFILIDTLINIKKSNPDFVKNILLYFTVEKLMPSLQKMIYENKLQENIIFTGNVPYTTVLSWYKSAHVLLFPSEIETFGLPLIEASLFGIPIIAADLPYATEVLGNYNNVKFINPHDSKLWAETILNTPKMIHKKQTMQPEQNTWEIFIKKINTILEE